MIGDSDFNRVIQEANRLYAEGKYTAAKDHYIHATRLRPDSFVAHANLGNTYLSLYEIEGAIHHYKKALSIKPSAPMILYNLGDAYQKQNRLSEAIEAYARCLQLNPGNADALVNLGIAYNHRGEIDAAIKCYKKALAISPSSTTAHHNMAIALYDSGNWTESQKHFKTACDQIDANPLSILYSELLFIDLKPEIIRDLQRKHSGDSKTQSILQGLDHILDSGKASVDFRILGTTLPVLDFALSQKMPDGLHLEFGVLFANSLNHIARRIKTTVYGFDSFEGLPESWNIDACTTQISEPKGSYSTHGHLPQVLDNVILIPGWFDQTLPGFMQKQAAPVAFANIDCDIYSSTQTILEYIGPRLLPNSVIVFDEYIGYPAWKDHEHKAWIEYVSDRNIQFDYIAASVITGQVIVRIQ